MFYIWLIWVVFASILVTLIGNIAIELQAYLWCGFGLFLGLTYTAFLYLSKLKIENNTKWNQWGILLLVIFAHIAFLASKPIKEDDYFRYSLDGRNSRIGLHPYAQAPNEISLSNAPEYIDKINFPDYKTIYPPIAQLFFLSEVLYPDTIFGWWIQLILLDLIAVILSWLYLIKNKIHWQYFAFLWLNPIWLKEGLNSGHLDVLAGILLGFSIYFYSLPSKKYLLLSVILISFAMGLRPWLGIFGLYFLFTGKFKFFLLSGLIFIVPWVILFSLQNAPPFFESMSSWEQFMKKWEFNSLFYDSFHRINKFIFIEYNWARGLSWLIGSFLMIFIFFKTYKKEDYVFWCVLGVAIWMMFQPTANAWYFLPGIIVSGAQLLIQNKNENFYKGFLTAFATGLPLSYMHYLDIQRDFLDFKWALAEILLILLTFLLFCLSSRKNIEDSQPVT